jgi:hypothetical protein
LEVKYQILDILGGVVLRGSAVFFALIVISILPATTLSCSMAGCAGDGAEMRQSFKVRVLHDDKPLPGVTVRIARTGEGGDEKFFLGTTDSNGLVHVTNLPSGNYWIFTDLLGISGGTQCFHVAEHSTSNALKSLKYDWGDMAPTTKSVQGTLVNSQPGQTGTPIERLVHRVYVPIPNAKLTLHDAHKGSAIATSTDDKGNFSYPGIPNGTYVLHIDSGEQDWTLFVSFGGKLAAVVVAARRSNFSSFPRLAYIPVPPRAICRMRFRYGT